MGLVSCGGGGSPVNISMESTTPSTGSDGQQYSSLPEQVERVYGDLSSYTREDMQETAYDPNNIGQFAFDDKSVSSIRDQFKTLDDIYANWGELASYLAFKRGMGEAPDKSYFNQIAIWTSEYSTFMAEREMKYDAFTAIRSVSAAGTPDIMLEQIGEPKLLAEYSSKPGSNSYNYTVYEYRYPFGDLGPTDISFTIGGSGSAWVGARNYTDLNHTWWGGQKVASAISPAASGFSTDTVGDLGDLNNRLTSSADTGFQSGGTYTVTLNSNEFSRNERFISSYESGAVGVFYIVVENSATVVGKLGINVGDRWQDNSFVGTTGYNFGATSIEAEIDDNRQVSSAQESVTEVDYNAIIGFQWEFEANMNFEEVQKRQDMVVGFGKASDQIYTDNDQNSPDEQLSVPAGTHTWYVAGYNLDGQAAWVEAGTLTLGLMAPYNLVATYDSANGLMVLTWTKSSQIVTNYEVYFSTDGGATWTLASDAVGDVNTYSHDVSEITVPSIAYRIRGTYTNPNDVDPIESAWCERAFQNNYDDPLADEGSVTGSFNSVQTVTSSGDVYMIVSDDTNYDIYQWSSGSVTSDQNVASETGSLVAATNDSGIVYFLTSNEVEGSEGGLRLYSYDTSDGSISSFTIENCSYSGGNLVYRPGNSAAIKVINGTVSVIYSSGVNGVDLKYYEVGGDDPYVVSTASSTAVLLTLDSLSTNEPRVSYTSSSTISLVYATSANPADSGDWSAVVSPTGISGPTRMAVGNDILWLFSAQNPKLQFAYSANSSPASSEWTIHDLTASNGLQYGYPNITAAVVNGVDIPIITYAVKTAGEGNPWSVFCLSTGHVTGEDEDNNEQNFISPITTDGVWMVTDLDRTIPSTALQYRALLGSSGGSVSYVDTILDFDGESASYDANLFCGSL